MIRSGKPKLFVQVWGDWYTIIGARRDDRYRDVLLDQKPDDEEDAQYKSYRIPCATTDEVIDALLLFRRELRLRCAVAMDFTSEDKAVRAYASTGDGYAQIDRPFFSVTVERDESAATEAMTQARDLLNAALS